MVNRKYDILQNEEWLKEQLDPERGNKSVMQLSKEIAAKLVAEGWTEVTPQIIHGCITYRKNRWPDDTKKKVRRQRQPNQSQSWTRPVE